MRPGRDRTRRRGHADERRLASAASAGPRPRRVAAHEARRCPALGDAVSLARSWWLQRTGEDVRFDERGPRTVSRLRACLQSGPGDTCPPHHVEHAVFPTIRLDVSSVIAKSLQGPDGSRAFLDDSRRDLVALGTVTVGRAVYRPGWRWSVHARRRAGSSATSLASRSTSRLISAARRIRMAPSRVPDRSESRSCAGTARAERPPPVRGPGARKAQAAAATAPSSNCSPASSAAPRAPEEMRPTSSPTPSRSRAGYVVCESWVGRVLRTTSVGRRNDSSPAATRNPADAHRHAASPCHW